MSRRRLLLTGLAAGLLAAPPGKSSAEQPNPAAQPPPSKLPASNFPIPKRPVPKLPGSARLALSEDWSSGRIDPEKWYPLRKHWGQGHAGVVPENVLIVDDLYRDQPIKALRCEAHGDLYDGPVTGRGGRKPRVGGVLVSKQHFASGRFEVVMKIGTPQQPKPTGMVPAIWTYGYRLVKVPEDLSDHFSKQQPLYHPYLQKWGKGMAFYWSEIDFPEYGKAGDYKTPMYNTFLNKQHHSLKLDAGGAADGHYHTYVTEWRTALKPVEGIKDEQVVLSEGYYWAADQAIPYHSYWGQPFKRLGPDRYAVYAGKSARHWIDGNYMGENTRFVPSMTGQLNLGVWLPDWAGKAPWKTSAVHIASVKVWQYDDPGDVRGILSEDISNNF